MEWVACRYTRTVAHCSILRSGARLSPPACRATVHACEGDQTVKVTDEQGNWGMGRLVATVLLLVVERLTRIGCGRKPRLTDGTFPQAGERCRTWRNIGVGTRCRVRSPGLLVWLGGSAVRADHMPFPRGEGKEC